MGGIRIGLGTFGDKNLIKFKLFDLIIKLYGVEHRDVKHDFAQQIKRAKVKIPKTFNDVINTLLTDQGALQNIGTQINAQLSQVKALKQHVVLHDCLKLNVFLHLFFFIKLYFFI